MYKYQHLMSNYKYRRDHCTGDESSSSASSNPSSSSSFSWNRSSLDHEERGLDWWEQSSPPNQDDRDKSHSNSSSSTRSTIEVKRNEKDRDRHDSGRSNATFPRQFHPPTPQTSNDSLNLIASLFADASDAADACHDCQDRLTEQSTVVLPESKMSTEPWCESSEQPSPERVRDLVGATRRRPRYDRIFQPEEWSSRQMIVSMIACGLLLLVVLAMIVWGMAALVHMIATDHDAEGSTKNLYEPCRYHSDCESANSVCVLPLTDPLQQQPPLDAPICCPNEQLVRVDTSTLACGKRSHPVDDGQACTSALECRVSSACAAASLEEEAASICCPSGRQLHHEGTGRNVCDDAPLGTVCGDFQVMCRSGLCLLGRCAEERLDIRQECSSDFECKTNLCGRTIDQIAGSPTKVCCASQQEHQPLLGQSSPLEKEGLCTDMPIGTFCNDDGICASRHCLEGMCAEPMLLQDLQPCSASNDCRSGACSFESVGNSAEQVCCPNGETVDHIRFGSLDFQTTCGSMPNGVDCSGNAMCASGQCIQGICSAP